MSCHMTTYGNAGGRNISAGNKRWWEYALHDLQRSGKGSGRDTEDSFGLCRKTSGPLSDRQPRLCSGGILISIRRRRPDHDTFGWGHGDSCNDSYLQYSRYEREKIFRQKDRADICGFRLLLHRFDAGRFRVVWQQFRRYGLYQFYQHYLRSLFSLYPDLDRCFL